MTSEHTSSPTIARAHQLAAEHPWASARARIQWARDEAATQQTLTDLGLPIDGPSTGADGCTDPIPLAAEGWTLTLGVRWDDMPYEPGDCHDIDQYDDCRRGQCKCFPAEVVFVSADVHDPAGRRVAWDALFGIGCDDATRDPYVLQVLAECARNACAEAGVNAVAEVEG